MARHGGSAASDRTLGHTANQTMESLSHLAEVTSGAVRIQNLSSSKAESRRGDVKLESLS